jgi:ubiquitin carboxyl-terminal hydrolase 2/21
MENYEPESMNIDTNSNNSRKQQYNDGLVRIQGMRNLGNTCYMNSALQALLSSNILNYRLLEYTQSHQNEVHQYSPMLREYTALVHHLIDATNDESPGNKLQGNKPNRRVQQHIIPRNFKDTLSKENNLFAGYEQRCSHELITFMLDDFTELPINLRKPITPLKDGDTPPPQKREFTGIRKILNDTYFGTSIVVIRCKECGNVKKNTDYHPIIQVPLPLSNDVRQKRNTLITIADCFNQYKSTEICDGDSSIDCDNCKKRTTSTKRTELSYVPELTILAINRFRGTRKINDPVKIYPKIELDGYPLRLISTINHSGSVNGGHYTAYVSRSWYDDKGELEEHWFMANDSNVGEVDKERVFTDPLIYMAIYERVQ